MTMFTARDPRDLPPPVTAAALGRVAGFGSLAGINRRLLEHWFGPRPGAPAELAGTWQALDEASRLRLAACPYLLADLRLADTQAWNAAAARTEVVFAAAPVGTAPAGGTSPAAGDDAPLARVVCLFAWHLLQAHPAPARIILALPLDSTPVLGRLTLAEADHIGSAHPHWLEPRWPLEAPFWRSLLAAAAEPEALDAVRLQGVLRLAAGARRDLDLRAAGSADECGVLRGVVDLGRDARRAPRGALAAAPPGTEGFRLRRA